jgi:hypothetical protein
LESSRLEENEAGMETRFVDMSEREIAMPAGVIRNMAYDEWVCNYASGSLQKAKKLGFSFRPLYLEERVAHEFGWGFKIAPRSRLTFGDALMEGDNSSLTETVWHSCRIIDRNQFPDSDVYEVKYINAYESDIKEASAYEGVGLILRQTSAKWLPTGHIVYAIIAEWKNNRWERAQNPC